MDLNFQNQIDMHVYPTKERNVVTLQKLENKYKNPCRLVCVGNFASTYNTTNLTLTSGSTSSIEIDGVNLNQNDRILFVGQTNKAHNGIYRLDTSNITVTPQVFVRDDDMLTTNHLEAGALIPVLEGDNFKGSLWMLSTYNPSISTNLDFIHLSGTVDLSEIIRNLVIEINGE